MAFQRNAGFTSAIATNPADTAAGYLTPTRYNLPLVVSGAISGGIPYFSSATTEASSALLTAQAAVMGGGAGTAPYASTILSEGTATGQGIIVAAGTATTVVSPETISQTRNNAGVIFPGVVWTFTETAVSSTSKFFQILGGATGTTNQFSLTASQCIIAPALMAGGVYGSVSGTGLAFDGSKYYHGSTGLSVFGSSQFAADVGISWISGSIIGVGTGAAGSSIGSIRAKFQSSDGTVGVAAFGPSVVTSITVKDGIITAIS